MELAYNKESVGRASQLTWERLSPPVRERKLAPVEQPEWKPPPGERNRKLLDEGCISLAREERLQELWVTRLKLELRDIGAPVLAKLQGSLDPDRAANLLVGRTRSSTLKRYLTYYKQWRLWLGEAKLRLPPGRPADLVDFLRRALWAYGARGDAKGHRLGGASRGVPFGTKS